MRGAFQDQTGLFSYNSLEERVPEKHPLRDIRELVRAVLVDMNRDFAALYSDEGRPSIFPEQLVSALLLQAFYGLRANRTRRHAPRAVVRHSRFKIVRISAMIYAIDLFNRFCLCPAQPSTCPPERT
jgi:hypothetical protein